MIATSPEHAVELIDRAFNEGNIEAVLEFYEAPAVVVMAPGELARGHEELRRFFTEVIAAGASARQVKHHVIEADGVALFLSRWTLAAKPGGRAPSPRHFVATTVFRKQPTGGWKAIIDNSLGPLVLGPE
ncbi:YybH family protein [Acidisoma sp. C75]